jgi:hypothetical protein
MISAQCFKLSFPTPKLNMCIGFNRRKKASEGREGKRSWNTIRKNPKEDGDIKPSRDFRNQRASQLLQLCIFPSLAKGDDKALHSDSMASFCQRLPPELWLHIVSYLSIPDIHVLQRVSKLFNTLMCLNESSIYRAAAIHHGFAPAAVPDIQTVTTHRKRKFDWLSGVKTWLHYCAFAGLDALHLFIDAPRQATYGHSKKLVSERSCCPLCGLRFWCSSTSNQGRRRGGHCNRNS